MATSPGDFSPDAHKSEEKLSTQTKSSLQLVAIAALLTISLATYSEGQLNVTTYHNDNARTGQIQETVLTTGNVNKTSFGKLFSYAVDGYVYAQPLYLQKVTIPKKGIHNVVYVATEHDSLFAFDADSNTGINASPLWKKSFINPTKGITSVLSSDVACNDLVPEIGITGTPVIDTSTGTLYLVAKTKENGQIVQRLHALDVTSGREKFGGPVVIQVLKGTVSLFDPLKEGQRPALLLQNGQVYIGWASHCDNSPYFGWIIAYDAHSLQQVGVWNSTPTAGFGGVWQSGGGLAGDANFNTYFATGNGLFDVNTGGFNYGDSIVKLAPPNAGLFTVADYFTPADQASLNNGDIDLGAGGVLLLPDQPPGSPHQQLLVQSGKEGTLYLIDRTRMGHYHFWDQVVQEIPGANRGMWSSPAWWNNTVYLCGAMDLLKAFAFDVTTGQLSTSPTSQSATLFGFPPPTPSISANGNLNPIVWAIQTDAYLSNGPAVLHAYDATNLASELYNSQMVPTRDNPGTAVKFSVPTVVNGKVYVGAGGQLSIYGLF